MIDDRPGPYRSRSGRILGVLKGLSLWSGLPLVPVRVLYVLLTLFTGVWPGVGIYLLAALLLRPEPLIEPDSASDRDFYHSYASSPRSALARLRDKTQTLERRIQRIEDTVTSRDYDWDRRMNE